MLCISHCPRLLTDLSRQTRNIAFLAYAAQIYFFLVFGATECLLLTSMAYDSYVVICNPLLYPLLMNCVSNWPLAVGSVEFQCIVLTHQIFSLPFCGSNQSNHFCDVHPVLKLALGDTFMTEILFYVIAILVVTIPFMLILGSYVRIIVTILKLPSATGQAKASPLVLPISWLWLYSLDQDSLHI